MAKKMMEIEEAAVQEAPTSKTPNRDRFMSRMKNRMPDREYADDEELFGQIESDYANAEENEKTIGSLNKMLAEDPRSGAFISRWYESGDPILALVEEYGEEIAMGLQDEGNKKKFAEANKKYLDKIANSKKLEELYKKNMAESQKMIDSKIEGGVSAEDVDATVEFLQKMYTDLLTGVVTSETFDLALGAIKHDSDVAQAAAEAEVRGRNANIGQKLRRAKAGDGIPNLGGGSAVKTPEQKPSMGALDRYGNGGVGSIWDKG